MEYKLIKGESVTIDGDEHYAITLDKGIWAKTPTILVHESNLSLNI